ncbi:MAG: reverse transcriptase domain-containing protein, partial [bacterium]
MVNTLKRNTLLDACLNGNGNIFVEIRKLRKSRSTVANIIDGEADNIPKHFADIYSKLYNSVDDQNSLNSISCFLNEKICPISLEDAMKVTPALVRDAVIHLNSNKSDPTFQFTSDCLMNAPANLYEHLATLFRFYLIHGHISDILMLVTLLPLVKDKLGDITSSDNYRSIAISSLVLKIVDWIIILLYGDRLQLDNLQFAYQPSCSTSMCTWMAVETIEYFLRNGSEVFTCVMDMTKAFDNVKHSMLFQKLIDKGIPGIYIRLLLVMYDKQHANVKWNGTLSESFPIKNGVKQGAVLSAILYCVYVDGLFKTLRRQKSGCWINNEFYGILGYADDLFLLSPTLDGLQDMVKTCGSFAKMHNLSFSTNSNPSKCKTKCMAFLKSERTFSNIKLNGVDLPWVTFSKHLGNRIDVIENGMCRDLMEKRASYINRNNELLQEFHFAHPMTLVKINNLFNTAFYGSTLWNLFGKEAE